MPDMILFQGAITSLKAAADLAIGLSKLQTMAEVQGKAVELQRIILAAQSSALSAQSEQFSLIERMRELEKEIADVRAWEETKQRYQLVEPAPGNFVFAPKKEEGQSPEPSHWICAKCYDDGRRSILQAVYRGQLRVTHKCFTCQNQFDVPKEAPPPRVVRSPEGGGPRSWMGR